MIGWIPEYEDIFLTKGDFIFARTSDLGDIPALTVIELIWDGGPTWPATDISGAKAFWRIESTAHVGVIDDGDTFTIWVRYPNGAAKDDYEWIKGSARRSLLEFT